MMKHRTTPTLAIVIPCYNEEEVLPETLKRLDVLYRKLCEAERVSPESYLLFVDDGSIDGTWEILSEHARISKHIKALKLSKNEGHQYALLAGMDYVTERSDCMISMDADLQQDPMAVFDMLESYSRGNEIILGIREDRSSDTIFKKMTAEGYYRLMRFMGVEIEFNHADYRLMSQKALRFFSRFKERNLFIRGMVKLIGLQTDKIYFKATERFAGESKYSLKKMLSFAMAGITSFSVVPLKLITISGFIIFLLSMIAGIDAFYTVTFTDKAVPGWASTVLPMYFLGGVELLSIGILGEYIGRIYTETKGRPHYFIEEELS